MMMNRILFALILLSFTAVAWACPGCAGSDMGKNKTPYTLIVLSTFILLTYIPFYMMFKAAKKFDPKNAVDDNL